MQYMLLIYSDEAVRDRMPEEELERVMGKYFAYTQELKDAGVYLAGDALHRAGEARSVRVRDGETTVTDGPFAETREQLGGYYLVEVDSLEDAEAWAAKIPTARFGTIEVRRVVIFDRAAA